MSKAYFFAIFLLAASFTGCIGDENLDELSEQEPTSEEETTTVEDDEPITPVGTNTTANMAPYVIAGVWLSNDDYVIFDPSYDDEARLGIYVNWAAKDFDGSIVNAGFDLDLDMNIDVFVEEDFGILINNTSADNETLKLENSNWNYDFVLNNDICGLIFHTTFAFIALDNEGAAGIELVQFVLRDWIDYEDMMGIKNDFPGLFGITDDMEDLFDDPNCGGGPNSDPIATFFVSEDSGGRYHIEVIKVSRAAPLEDFSFFLKDDTGSVYVGGNGFGEVAMQIISGSEFGIDTSYTGEDDQLKNRATNVSNDDGSVYPVHFSDNDRDGFLSAGDQFMVYGTGNSANGPAADNWKLDIQFDLTGNIIGSARLL